MSELTLVFIGNTNSTEIGSENILLDHDKQTNVDQFSDKLYDLCGRRISVINMLGLHNFEDFPLNQGIHAFLLLLSNGLHKSQYRSGYQWLEEMFGQRALSYVMTVVTYEADENYENALTDLKDNISMDERRYHTCTRTMMDANEIIDLLSKIDVMVSKNDPKCYSKQMFEENIEQKQLKDHKSHKKDKMDSTVFQQNERDKEVSNKNNDISLSECSIENSKELKGPEQMSETSLTKEDELDKHSDKTEEEQSDNISEENKMTKQNQEETKSLFCRLHLEDKLQQRLSPADFLRIGRTVKQDLEVSEKDLAQTFLQRLMMLDYRARYIPVKQVSPEVSNSGVEPVTVDTDESDLDAFYSASTDNDQSKQTHVHPLDVQMAVFHCSDSFFKQNMITKLSQCQYALPLLVPDPVSKDIEFPLWTFRQISKTWKISKAQNNSDTFTMKTMPIYKAETPMVSFFRLGSLSVSKSQLINNLINDRHNTFFHRNCPGSTKSRLLMDGVAEIAWYCPAGKPNDAFTDCVTFCNLRGDALVFEQQREILSEKSSITVVLVPTLKKGDTSSAIILAHLKSKKPLIVLNADDDCSAIQMKRGKYKMGLRDRSPSDVSAELQSKIRQILTEPHESFRLETMAEVSGIRLDEDDTVCKKGKSAAVEIVNLFQGMDVSDIKRKFLPCQGKLWHDWCRVDKELYHLKGHIEMEKSKKEQELKQIREDQCTASCSELMKMSIKGLSSLPPADKEYFLKWTQILIDDLSTDDLSSVLQDYDEKWSEVLALKKKHEESKQKQSELEQLSTKLQSATFGLEHIFREMGQIYEAHKSLKKQLGKVQTDWSKYPELAAELMISGHPMELMDGDAGHVPLTWISGLLDEVIKKLGDQRVYVLSVLGVQSSGKSTMLNAMFGLQFAVSAGRCTKGAFMQLVKVSKEMKEDLQFDYVLVVDTEGLRALELAGNATLHHDNELATFVVGVGNLTLINIFGENPADMQDILQIVVQAFMRMKKVKLSPSCVFVHQNVTDITATEKNMDGKRRLQEKLDQMTQLAAKEEGSDAECFSDVIEFDVQRDVKYFAQLWEGSPPMAPPNPGYSESVQELKNLILSKASTSPGVTLSQFKSKIKDLWNALINENFVFSFKNTLEIVVYRKLEKQYGNWTWTLRRKMLTIENQLYTTIKNGKLDQIELSYLTKEISKTYEEIKKEMKIYFDEDTDKEMLVQWRGRFETKIKEFHDEQVRDVKRKLDGVLEQKEACKKVDEQKTKFENKLLQQSKELAQKLKDKAKDDKELQQQFDSVWIGWVSELTAGTKPIEDINLEEDQYKILQELGFEWAFIDECKRNGKYKRISKIGDYTEYVSMTKHQKESGKEQGEFLKIVRYVTTAAQKVVEYIQLYLQHEYQQRIKSLIDDIEQQTTKIIKSKPVATTGYTSTYLQELTNNVIEKVITFESHWKFALKKEFKVDLLLYVFHRAESFILESHEKFRMNNDAGTFIESKKLQYYNIFRSFCKGSSSAVVLGELICEKLRVSTVEAVCNKTAIDLAGQIRTNVPAFNGNKLNLEKHVLKSLAGKENFDDYITYIRNPRKQVESFIKDEVNKYIFTKHEDKAVDILRKNIEDMKTHISQALFTATEKVKTQKGNTDMWLKEFSDLLRDRLTFDAICSQNFSDINNFDFLKEQLEKSYNSITNDMRSLSLDKIKASRLKPDQILIDQLCKCCWVQCPFCAAVCTNTLEDHSPGDHSVPFHRSAAVNGVHYRDMVDMSIEFCTTKVASDGSFYPDGISDKTFPFKLYRTAGPRFANWSITPDESMLIYWKWFVVRFQTDLEKYYNKKFQGYGEIPSAWKKHTKAEAIESLNKIYNL